MLLLEGQKAKALHIHERMDGRMDQPTDGHMLLLSRFIATYNTEKLENSLLVGFGLLVGLVSQKIAEVISNLFCDAFSPISSPKT